MAEGMNQLAVRHERVFSKTYTLGEIEPNVQQPYEVLNPKREVVHFNLEERK